MDTAPATVDALARWWSAGEETPWIVETSGSTGRPKRVVLARRAVEASVALSGRRLGATGRWLLALPGFYVAGVNVITRSLAAGQMPVLLEEHNSFREAARELGEGGFVSLVPTQLQRLLASPEDAAVLAGFHTVLLGGGPADPSLRVRAAEAGVHVVTTYGSAETCGGCVYDGVPLDGVGLEIDAEGRVRLSGPTLFSRYDGDAALTRETLVDGWFQTSDAGLIGEDGRLELLGRVDDMVVTGGMNVPAALVARRLREHPAVDGAEVLGVPDEEWGNRLVAFVEGQLALDEARDWVSEAHPRAWAPRQLVVLPHLPLLANGKADRLALRDLATGAR
jgi:O-succinylbenzoic acid--CoA ligase